MDDRISGLLQKSNKLPLLPGVYIMKDEPGEVIYVGKAKQLKNRVTSYFRGEHDSKTSTMVAKVRDFDVIVAASEFEALILENSLIKRHQPKYNILLRDDKGFPFIRVDERVPYPKFKLVSKMTKDGARYFGPYGGRRVTHEIIDMLCKALKLPSCNRKFPRDIGKERPCLNFHMGACEGYCRGDPGETAYRRSLADAYLFLNGQTKELTQRFESEMEQAAERLLFERAGELRDRLRSVQSLSNRQRVVRAAFADLDAVGFYRGAKSCFSVLHYTEGELSGKDYELMEEPMESDAEAVSALVRQYYERRGSVPKSILLPTELEDGAELERFLTESFGARLRLEVPKRGERRELIAAAELNAREEAERAATTQQKQLKTLQWLQRTLGLEQVPERIEAFDVSNLGDSGVVAAMTVHRQGKPLKRDYRRFKIRDVAGQDDYHSMQEAVRRRFARYIEGDEKFTELPNLLLIDGGATHAKAAVEVLRELGLELPVYGMVKDSRHRTRGLMSPEGEEIGLVGNPAVFALVGRIQEETHRFAIEYQRSLRTKNVGSVLDGIKGVGERRRNELLRAFGSVKNIRAASFERLCEVVPKNTARSVYDFFHENHEDNQNAGDAETGQEDLEEDLEDLDV